MKITIQSARVPARSTVGILTGTAENGDIVSLACDHRSARYIDRELAAGDHVVLEPSPENGIVVLEIIHPDKKEEELAAADFHASQV